MTQQRWSDKEIKEAVHKYVHEMLELGFITDKDFASRAFVRAFHSILRQERYDIFMDDLLNYVASKDEQKHVY